MTKHTKEVQLESTTECKSYPYDICTDSEDAVNCEPADHECTVLQQLNSFRIAGDFCDAKMVAGGQVWMCHQCILAANSTLLCKYMKEVVPISGNIMWIELPEKALPYVGSLLEMFYTGKLSLALERVQGTLLLASYLELPFVERCCADIMKDHNMPVDEGRKQGWASFSPPKISSLPADYSPTTLQMEDDGNDSEPPQDQMNLSSGDEGSAAQAFSSLAKSKKSRARKAKEFPCSFCKKVFPRKADAVVHERRKHTKVKPFACPQCDEKFVINRQLKVHMQLHANKDLLKCDKCDKRFTTVEGLKQHVANIHEPKPFRCTNPNCVRSFASEAQLTNHSASCCARSHSGPDQDQQHQCDSCGRPFKSRHLLQRHVACVHLKLKPFKCDQCGRAFGRKEMLKQHRAAHTGRRDYVCGVCEKSFRQSASLYMHKLQHSGDHKVVCDICGYGCFGQAALRKHLLSHSLVKPHQCSLCDKSFKTTQYLKRHQHTVHEGNGPVRKRRKKTRLKEGVPDKELSVEKP